MLPVTLTRYGQTFHLPREAILSMIPESLLGQALQEEPDVPEIQLENPDVTLAGMQVISDYLNGKEPTHAVPGLSSTARYLNVPWLVYYEDPLYNQVVRPLPGQSWDVPANQNLLNTAAEQNDILMVNYLLQKNVTPIFTKNASFFPHSWQVSSLAMDSAISNDNLAMVQLLRQKISPNDFEDIYLERAISEQKNDIVFWMLQDPVYDATLPLYLDWAARFGNLSVLQYLLTRTDPSYEDNMALKSAVEGEQPEALKILLQDPRVKPETIQDTDNRLNAYLSTHGHPERSEVYTILSQDRRLPNRMFALPPRFRGLPTLPLPGAPPYIGLPRIMHDLPVIPPGPGLYAPPEVDRGPAFVYLQRP
jgi:hypothetical protein